MRENDMGTKKVFPLVCYMAFPPMLSMLIQSLYNIIDSIFVARLSQDALSAVSIVFPIQNMMLSIAVGAGVGLNSYIARNMGAGNRKKAEEAVGVGLILSVFQYLFDAIVGLLILRPFVGLYATNEHVLKYCMDYGVIIVLFSFGQMLHITLEKIFQAMGKMMISMTLQAAGCVVNIVLDPILIFGLGPMPALGVKGAAIATVAGQMTSAGIGVILFLKGKSELRSRKLERRDEMLPIVKQIYAVGIPSALVMALPSFLVSGLNVILSGLTPIGVAVFGIYYKLQTFVYMPVSGLIQGIRPLVGFQYGAKLMKREKEIMKYSILLVGTVMVIGTLLFWLIPDVFLGMFDATEEMYVLGERLLRIVSIAFVPSAVGIIIAAEFEGIGKGVISLIITLLRQFIILLPIAIISSRSIGTDGVWIAFPIAETVAAVVAVIFLRKEWRSRDWK